MFSLNLPFFKQVFLLCAILFTSNSFGQDSLQPTVFEAVKIPRQIARNPVLLANKLIEGKNSEKEKFDAIFTWVVRNVRYDNRAYNSGKAFSSIRPVKRVLGRRKGICTDYAHLMDTLCDIAGIANVTVTGYTKEMNFDLNDTLYFDNHAWNAVKLNGLWYVYDPTWCSGYSRYDYTRLGKWRIRTIDKIYSKSKQKTISFTIKKNKKNKFCGIPGSEVLGSKTITTLSWWRIPLIKMLNFFKYRIKVKYVSIANSKYYLANPEEFSRNHFPNNPTWSLTQRVGNAAAFSADSAYFYEKLPDSVSTKREGRFCLDCDNYYYSDLIKREGTLASQSLKSNPYNRFVPANYNLFMAQTIMEKVYEEEDSLTKMNLIDSTLNYIDTCKLELRNSKTANRIDSRFQTRKNKAKKDQLLAENKIHRKRSADVLKEVNRRRVKVRSLIIKAESYEKRGRQSYNKFQDAFDKKTATKAVKGEVETKIRMELETARNQSDSLTQQIAMIQTKFLAHAKQLWGNLLVEDTLLLPLANAFYFESKLRFLLLMDSYDYRVIENRKDLNEYEQLFLASVDTNILLLSDTFYAEFMHLNDLIKKRNALDLKSVKWVMALKGSGLITADSLLKFKEQANQRMKDDACWNADNAALIAAVTENYLFFLDHTRYYAKVVRQNDHIEEKRYFIHYKHLQKNKLRNNKAIDGNSEIASDMRRTLVAYRSSYLRKLRAEQMHKQD